MSIVADSGSVSISPPSTLSSAAIGTLRGRSKFSSTVFLGKVLRVLCVFLLAFISGDVVMYMDRAQNDPSNFYTISLVVMSGFTVLFGIVGFVGTSIYDTFMVVCFTLFIVLRQLTYAWQISCAAIFELGSVYMGISVVGLVLMFGYEFVAIKFARAVSKDGAPDALSEMSFDSRNRQSAAASYGAFGQ